MSQQQIKDYIDDMAATSGPLVLGSFRNIRPQSALAPQDILEKMTYAITNAIAQNNAVITEQLRQAGVRI